jgi:uncharacterized protein
MESVIGLNRIKRRDLFIVILLVLLSLPISYVAAKIPDFKNFYMNYPLTPVGVFDRFFMMFITEALFRGFLMLGLARKFGRWSVVLQDIPYAMAHIGKPLMEMPYSAAVGLVYGSIDYKSKSFLPSLLLHAIGSEIFIIMVHMI